MKRINDHCGIITSIKESGMTIELRRGGTIEAPIKDGLRIGDIVAFVMDSMRKKVADVILKKHADSIVARGENHLMDTAEREPIEEEDDHDGNTTRTEGWNDERVFYCSELQ